MHPTATLFAFLLLLLCSNCYSHGQQHVPLLETRRSDSILNSQILRKYEAIISFGDSYADTGNLVYYKNDQSADAAKPPYGETYFGHPSGRFSNGRLVIDFLAQALGLPLVPPYLAHKKDDFKQGVNFAVAGGTALDAAFFEKNDIPIPTNYSIGIQLDWFKQAFTSPSPSSHRKIFNNSLFLVGEIGLNDIVHSFSANKTLPEVKSMIPNVIDTITFVIKRLINEGATTMVVPGNVPIGCFPMYLTKFSSRNKDDYDPSNGCLKWLNKLAQLQNVLLKLELRKLRRTYPHINIIYADYYGEVMEMYRFPAKFGFKEGAPKACCGGGGPYNFNKTATCGAQVSTACEDPSKYVSWDGIHLTEAAYKLLADQILHKITSQSDNY